MPHALPRFAHAVRQHRGKVFALAVVLVFAGWVLYQFSWPRYHAFAARRALEAGDLESAQRHLEACARAWPHNAAVHFDAARTARRRDALDEARSHLETCERLGGLTAACRLEEMLLSAQQGNLEPVEAALQSLVAQRHPDRVLILEALARGYQARLRLADFINTAEALVELHPDHFQAHLWRGTAAESLGRLTDAVESYQKAVDLDPRSDEARLRLAVTLEQLGQPREAQAHLDYLRRRQPDNPEVLLSLARCRLDAHELADARGTLETLLEKHPDHVPALVERGRVAYQEESAGAAEGWLRRAIEHGPHDREAHRLLLAYLEAQGKDKAAADCRAALQRIEGATARSANLMRQVMEAPHDPGLRCELGVLLLHNGREEEGLHWLATALQEDPGHAPSHQALAAYYDEKGQVERAAQHRAQGK